LQLQAGDNFPYDVDPGVDLTSESKPLTSTPSVTPSSTPTPIRAQTAPPTLLPTNTAELEQTATALAGQITTLVSATLTAMPQFITLTVQPTQTPTETLTPISTSLPTSTLELIEAEWPKTMDLNNTGTVRIALVRASSGVYQPAIEIMGNTALIDNIAPVGTPQVSLRDAFGPNYHVFATANLVNSAFDIVLVSRQPQPFDQDRLDWVWNISPKRRGEHILAASVSILWMPGPTVPITKTTIDNNSVYRQVWHGYFKVDVTEPLIRPGSYTLIEIWDKLFGAGALGLALGALVPKAFLWFYRRFWGETKQTNTAYLGVAAAATKMGITRENVRVLCSQGKLPGAIRDGPNKPWSIPSRSVEDWINNQKSNNG
jgi:hypothetical protein